jgi:Ca-activated chloride channel family protein
MAAVQRRIGTPLLAGLQLDVAGLAVEPGEIVPRRLPDLFPDSPLLILGRYCGRTDGAITIRGAGAGGTPYAETVPSEVRENPAIAAAWARGQIRQLEDRFAAGDGDRATLERAILGLSLRHQVLCRFTAYVAIDRSQVVNEGGSVHRITQPVDRPQGWADMSEFYGAATGMPSACAPSRGGGRRSVMKAFSRDRSLPPAMMAPERLIQAFIESPPAPAQRSANIVESGPSSPPIATLADRLRAGGPTPPEEAAALMADVAEELQTIHDRGQVCRSLTPATIFVGVGSRPIIAADCVSVGQVRETSKDIRLALSCYTPPEYLAGERDRYDVGGDLYTVGVILYELLTGRRPFRMPATRQERLEEILRGAPTPPRQIVTSLPAKLVAICLKAMARDPASRYASARELGQALRDFLKPPRKAFWK